MYAADLADLVRVFTAPGYTGFRVAEFKRWVWKRRENAILRLARRLPARLKMWVFYDIVSYASSERYGDTHVPSLTAMDAIKRYSDDHGLK